jgi:hypothetical protein
LAVSRAELDAVLIELSELIASSDYRAATRLEAAQPLFIAAGLRNELEPLRQAVEDYDFDTAQALMEGLAS